MLLATPALPVGDDFAVGPAIHVQVLGDDRLLRPLAPGLHRRIRTLQPTRDLFGIRFAETGRHEQVFPVLCQRSVSVVGGVLVRVRGLVFQNLDELVEPCGDDGAERGAEPVDPVVVYEAGVDDCGAEGARWVQTAACEEDAGHFGDEEGEADALRGCQ